MMPCEANPYESPRTPTNSNRHWTGDDPRWVRVIFYAHLLATVGSALLSLEDTQRIWLPELAVVVLMPLPFTIVAGPFAMLAVVLELRKHSAGFKVMAVCGELLLSVIQLFVLLPLIQ